MSTQDNLSAFRRLIDIGFTGGDMTIVDELVDPDCIEHQRGNPQGSDGVKRLIGTLHGWLTPFRLEIEDIVAADDMVWARNRASGTNTGSVMGRPATGRQVAIDVIDIARFSNGRLVEHWGVADQLGLLIQLGHLPGSERAVAGAAGPERQG